MSESISDLLLRLRGKVGRESVMARAREMAPNVSGLQRTNLERWEKGDAAPTAEQLTATVRALDGTAGDLSIGISALAGVAVRVVDPSDDGTPTAAVG